MGFLRAYGRHGYRVDRVDVHDALEEALANALSHANYYGRRGILVVKKGKELSISNPGTIRVTKEEFYAGGNSDPRNPNILKMFGFVNVGERDGSISSQESADIGGYKSKTGARKLLDKMIEKDMIKKVGK